MKTTVFIFVLLFTLTAGGTSFTVKASTAEDRASWLWNTQMIVNNENGTLSFLESKQVNKIYLQIDRTVSAAVYRNFIKDASANRIKVYALDGAPGWVAPKGDNGLTQLMNWLSNYQSNSTPDQKFSGIHLDVEPYLYSGWSSNQADTMKAYQTILTKAKTSSVSLSLPLEEDIPFWFDQVFYKNSFGKGNLAEWVISKTNGVTVMAYRDSADMIINLVKNEIAIAGKYGKPLVVGVETAPSDEGSSLTFYEEGEAYMDQQLSIVESYFSGVGGYNGIAVHHVGSWMTMKP